MGPCPPRTPPPAPRARPRPATPETATLRQIGEFGLIEALRERFPQGEHVFLGPGDDAAVVRTPGGHAVVSTDVLVEGQHFRRDWASAADVGRKAVAQNLSDVNAMGGRAHSLVVGLVAPPETSTAWVLELAEGMAAEAAKVGASIVGGDVSRAARSSSPSPCSDRAAGARAPRRRAPRRRARPGRTSGLVRRRHGRAGAWLPLPRGWSSRRTAAPSRRTTRARPPRSRARRR